MSTLTIRVECLKAVAPFVSKEETRYYLRGVFFDKESILVATDGQRMVAICPIEYIGEIPETIIDIESIKKILQVKPSLKKMPLYVCFDDETKIATVQHGTEATGVIPLAAFPYKAIEGTFPEWRRVISDAENYNVSNEKQRDKKQNTGAGFNILLLASFQSFGPHVQFFMHNDKGAPHILTAKTTEFEALGVIMPMRSYDLGVVVPEWIKAKPKTVAEEKKEDSKELPM